MKVLFICGSGANQRALANKLHAVVPLSGVAIIRSTHLNANYRIFQRLASLTVGFPLRRAWSKVMKYYDLKFPSFPATAISDHENVNADSVFRLISILKPDLVLISGSNLLRQPLIDVISQTGRIINLHTGLSPFIKGGPNCTNWCLALGEFNLIGNTVMWLDSGIDSGSIISTEQTLLNGEESIEHLHFKVMEHAHDLYSRCLVRIRDDFPLPEVPQADLGKGRLFLSKHWTAWQILKAISNYYLYFNAATVTCQKRYNLVSLDC